MKYLHPILREAEAWYQQHKDYNCRDHWDCKIRQLALVGDGYINYIASDFLYHTNPHQRFNQIIDQLTSNNSMSQWVKEKHLFDSVTNPGKGKKTLADLFEAYLGYCVISGQEYKAKKFARYYCSEQMKR